MSNIHPSIKQLLARPSETMSGGEIAQVKKHLLDAVGILNETAFYETVARVGKSDPQAAHDMLMRQGSEPDFDPAFPMIRLGLLVWLAASLPTIEAVAETRDLYAEVQADLPGGPADRAREAAFRADPGRYLPGAERSSVALFRAPGFGMIRLNGIDLPWTYAAAGKVRSDYSELYALVEDGRFAGGILVGPAAAEGELALPDGYQFVAVELASGGRAA